MDWDCFPPHTGSAATRDSRLSRTTTSRTGARPPGSPRVKASKKVASGAHAAGGGGATLRAHTRCRTAAERSTHKLAVAAPCAAKVRVKAPASPAPLRDPQVPALPLITPRRKAAAARESHKRTEPQNSSELTTPLTRCRSRPRDTAASLSALRNLYRAAVTSRAASAPPPPAVMRRSATYTTRSPYTRFCCASVCAASED